MSNRFTFQMIDIHDRLLTSPAVKKMNATSIALGRFESTLRYYLKGLSKPSTLAGVDRYRTQAKEVAQEAFETLLPEDQALVSEVLEFKAVEA